MRLRSFTAETLPDAMHQVREELGLDAVILSTQELGGALGVKVMAALDSDLDDELDLQEPENLIETVDGLSEVLDYHQVPAPLANRLLSNASGLNAEDNVMALAGVLDGAFDFAPLPTAASKHPVMIIGPSGSGKTATAAKLCALARLAGQDASLITMDAEKAGGMSQAETFAAALEVPLQRADTATALSAVIAASSKDPLIVIDTPGVSPYDEAALQELRETADKVGAQTILVLPSGGDCYEQAECALAFRDAGTRHLIMTRLDSSRRYGGLLCAAHAGRFSLMGVGISAQIGNGLAPINPVSMARLLQPATNTQEHLSLVLGTL
ncbi:GTP-binding protein [Denitrobaculum tricleocarpae]|uniref:GTP-binding protein n=1 Tax=Denitrobaculum tricleocarpae TaxID=2591009 RepID=A0A545T3V1_9PROT|nr:GTP-binding protein [Denitrobaculum tricleocarpae]TQV71892.1 GTP-binding protein [Denitrobaculum tricleocarpae]